MRRWRFIPFVTLALALLVFPGRLLAQDVAKKEATPAPAPRPGRAPVSTRGTDPPAEKEFHYFGFMNDPSYHSVEKIALWVVLVIAIAGLIYALGLVNQVVWVPTRDRSMREVGAAIRQGANAYLARQFKAIAPLMVVLTGLLWATAESTEQVALGRAAAFFMGATFSWIVGFVGMSLAVRGNLRVAAAARTSYGGALQLGYRTGTITGMLTDGLGLLGGTIIFMMYGEHAYEVLLGFGFGGTLLALFMRVGGGIYTKAADVGADLVGKVEAGIPEDDPRNAATIADNVGDNVGDCAGMAADIFESLRSHDRGRHDPGLRQLRPQGRDFPVPGAGHRRPRLDLEHVHCQGGPRQHQR